MKINSQTWEKFQTSAKVEVGMVLNLLSQESLAYLRFYMPCYIYTMRKMEFKFGQNIENVHKGTFIVNNNSNVDKIHHY